MYFVGLPEQEKMVYATRVEALRRRFGHQHCFTGVGRTKEREEPVSQGAGRQRETSGQPSLSLERLCESGKSGTPCLPNGSRRGLAVKMRRAKLSDLGNGGGNRGDPGTIYKESSPGPQTRGVRAGSVLEGHGGEARGPDGRDQGRSGTEKTVGGTPGIWPAPEGIHGMSLVPPKRALCEGVPDQRF